MYNWSIDTKRLKKDKQRYEIWKLIQSINYGSDNQRLSKKKLIKAWPVIKNKLDPYKKRALEYLIWGKQYSLPNNLNFWNLLN